MIRLETPASPLRPAERYGLAVLVDAARLLPVDDPGADVVRAVVTNERRDDLDAFLGGHWALERGDGEVRFSRNVLTYVADVAGAGEEQRSAATDRYERVPSSENPLVRTERWREPVVSRHAAALRAAVLQVAGRRAVRLLAPWPGGRRWAAAFTHDLDVVAGWPVFTLLRLIELVGRAQLGRAARTGIAALGALGGGRNPVWRGVEDVLRVEAEAGLRASWFVLAGTPTPATWRAGDVTYRPESRVARRILTAVHDAGHEIGLHGSFATLRSAAAFRAERARLGEITGRLPVGVRQHFLRMRPGATQREMAAAGFTYDASYGFPDRNGFRLGTADATPAWDVDNRAPLPLDEAPLVWMDRAQSKYSGIEDPRAWVDEALELAATCREVEGLWVGLWHPNLSAPLGFPDAPEAFRELVRAITSREPFVDTLERLLAWRAARRSARARHVGSDGQVDLSTGREAPWPLVLEDGAGRPIHG